VVAGHYPSVERRVRFELMYSRHAPAVKAYALRRADAASADDVVAEVFLACWRRFDQVPPDPLPWLLGAARKVLSTQRRGERRKLALGARLAESAEPWHDPPPRLGDGALAGALARLSESDRELLLLIAWEGLTPTQAAAVLSIKPVAARVRLARARRRLARALAGAAAEPIASDLSPEVCR